MATAHVARAGITAIVVITAIVATRTMPAHIPATIITAHHRAARIATTVAMFDPITAIVMTLRAGRGRQPQATHHQGDSGRQFEKLSN